MGPGTWKEDGKRYNKSHSLHTRYLSQQSVLQKRKWILTSITNDARGSVNASEMEMVAIDIMLAGTVHPGDPGGFGNKQTQGGFFHLYQEEELAFSLKSH